VASEKENSLRIYHIRGDVEEFGLSPGVDFDAPLIV